MNDSTTSLKSLSTDVLAVAISDALWRDRLHRSIYDESRYGVHVAIFSEPFLSYVLAGTKTVDSRFSKHRIAPYGDVVAGDIILIKQASGPVVGVCSAERVWYYEMDRNTMIDIRYRFGALICADEDFWHSRSERAYGTLILLKDVRAIAPFSVDKKDRRGWVTVKKRDANGPVVVALAGPIGSGKTTLSRALAKEFDCKRASFGDHFRQLAVESGQNPGNRRLLQRLGEKYVGLSPDRLCRELLRKADWQPGDESLIVDGVRHIEILIALRQVVAPMRLFLVYVRRDQMRAASASTRVGSRSLALFDAHSTETQNDALRSSADVIVSGDSDINAAVSSVLHSLGGIATS